MRGACYYFWPQGSQYAFTQIFNKHKTQVYGIAYQLLKSRSLAEEIVQDVFMKIWVRRTELPDVECLDSYLFTISKNLTLDRLKKMASEAALKKVYLCMIKCQMTVDIVSNISNVKKFCMKR